MNLEIETNAIKDETLISSTNEKTAKQNILQGVSFFKLSWPIALEQFLYLLITIADALILSRVSVNAAAAVGACAFVIGFTLIGIVGFGHGSSICISHRFGEGRPLEAQSVARASLMIITLLGVCLGLLQFLLHNHIPAWLGLPPELQKDAGLFLSIVGGTTVLQAVMISIAFSLRSYGRPRESMYVAIFINIINIALAISAVNGLFGLPKLGVLGVSFATFFARLFGMFAILYIARKHLPFLFHFNVARFKEYCVDFKRYGKEIVRYGVPTSLEPLSYQGSQIIITHVIATLGAEALALRTYVWSIISVNTVFVMGFAQATQILVGRLYGAKLYEDAKQEFQRNIKISLVSTFAIVTIMWLLGKTLLSFFTHDPQMIANGSMLFAMGYLMEPGRMSNVITGSALRAVGDTKYPLYIGLIFMWGLSIPVAWFFGVYLGLGLLGVWFGLSCDEIIRGAMNYRHFQKGKWIKSGCSIA